MATTISDIILRAVGDVDDAEQDLDGLAARLNALDAQEAEAEFRLDSDRAKAQIADAKRQLRDLDRTTASPDVKLRSLELFMELEALEAKLAEIEHSRTTIDIRVRRGIIDEIQRVTAAIDGLNGAGGRGGGGGAGGSFLDSFGRRVKLLLALLPTLIPIIVTVGGALVGLAGSALMAAAGLGAVGIAAGAVLGPLLAIGIGAVAGFTSATKAAEELEAATEQLEAAEQAAADAARGVADAERGVTVAQRGARQAQEALRLAREDARAQAEAAVTAALDRVRAAEDALTDAQIEQTSATLALADAREQARRELEDLQLAEKGGKLGVDTARDALSDARRELDDLRRGGASEEEISDAKRRVRQAELDLEGAKLRATRATEDLNEAERKGVEGSDAVVSAKQRIADANDRIAAATEEIADGQRELLEAQSQETRKAPGVVAARRAVADAHRGVQDAVRGVNAAERQAAQTAAQLAEAQTAVAEANAKLAASGPASALALKQAGSEFAAAFRAMTSAGVDAMFRSIIRSMQMLRPLMAALAPAFTRLGVAIGASFERWAAELASPAWQAFFILITDAATRIVPVLTEAFIGLANVLRNIATVALPWLERGVALFAAWSRRTAESTSNTDALAGKVGTLVSHFSSWWDLIGAVGRALKAIFVGGAEPVQAFVERITAAVNKWSEWAESAEGQERIRQFFETTLVTFEKWLGLLEKIVELFIEWTELFAPLHDLVLDILTPIFDLLGGIVGLLNMLPGPIKTVLAAWLQWRSIKFLLGLAGGAGGILGALGKIPAALGRMLGPLASAGARLGGLATSVGSRLLPALSRLAPMFLRVAGPAGLAVAAALEWGDDLGRGIADLAGYGNDAIAEAEKVADEQGQLASDIQTVWSALPRRLQREMDRRGGWKAVFSEDQMRDLAARARGGGRLAGTELVDGAFQRAKTYGPPTLGNAAQFLADSINEAPFFKKGKSIGQSLADGIRAAAKLAGDAMKDVGKALSDLLPGSEPKDKSSPLRGLAARGAATVSNYAAGIAGQRGAVASQWAEILRAMPLAAGGRGRFVDPAGGRGGRGPAAAAAGGDFTMHNHFSVPGSNAPPDPDAAVAVLSRRLRARGWATA